MIQNPTRKVLSSMKKSGVKTLLMGGQACILYGAAEFSKDADFAILADAENLRNLRIALDDLQAQVVAVPPFEADFLVRGHAVHFRCYHPDCEKMHVDVMAKMRGVASFAELWKRRSTFQVGDEEIEALDIADLVKAKKTQRSKDWPMIQRLLESHYLGFRDQPTPARIRFWHQELRTPALLREAMALFRLEIEREAAVLASQKADDLEIERALRAEEDRERELDRIYWRPLKAELEAVRMERRSKEIS